MLEEFQGHLEEAKKVAVESEESSDRTSHLLAQVKNGVEHLTEKLQHIKAVSWAATGEAVRQLCPSPTASHAPAAAQALARQ